MILPLDDKEQRSRNGKLTPFEQKFNMSILKKEFQKIVKGSERV